MKLVEKKVKAGETETVTPEEKAPSRRANVIDLTELLKRSLQGGGRGRRRAGARGARGARQAPQPKGEGGAAKPAAKPAPARRLAPAKQRTSRAG